MKERDEWIKNYKNLELIKNKISKERDELKEKLDSKSFEVLNEKTFNELQTLKDALKDVKINCRHSIICRAEIGENCTCGLEILKELIKNEV